VLSADFTVTGFLQTKKQSPTYKVRELLKIKDVPGIIYAGEYKFP
jgi:hypothetical protein